MRHLFYYKMRQKFITKWDSYYKIQRLLQIPTVHCYKTDVSSIICDHHVYKEAWDAAIGEILEAALDDREEAKEYDKYSVGLYKKNISLDIYNRNSKFMFPFYHSRSRKQIKALTTGKQQRKLDLSFRQS